METKKFDIILATIFDNCKKVLCSKGREYQNTEKDDTNVFANFERAGLDLGMNKEEVLWVYFAKHKDSISKFIKDMRNKSIFEIEENLSEPIDGRILDAINYLLLLQAMISERRDTYKKIATDVLENQDTKVSSAMLYGSGE
jgi:arsenate reductase-like glutaredoxin family protein